MNKLAHRSCNIVAATSRGNKTFQKVKYYSITTNIQIALKKTYQCDSLHFIFYNKSCSPTRSILDDNRSFFSRPGKAVSMNPHSRNISP